MYRLDIHDIRVMITLNRNLKRKNCHSTQRLAIVTKYNCGRPLQPAALRTTEFQQQHRWQQTISCARAKRPQLHAAELRECIWCCREG